MDKLTPGMLRDMAALNDTYDNQIRAGTCQTRGGFLRDEAAQREGEAKAYPRWNGSFWEDANGQMAVPDDLDSAATPPEADAPDELVQRLKVYEALGPLACLPIHPGLPWETTAGILRASRDAIARIEQLQKRVAELESAFRELDNTGIRYREHPVETGARMRAIAADALKGADNG